MKIYLMEAFLENKFFKTIIFTTLEELHKVGKATKEQNDTFIYQVYETEIPPFAWKKVVDETPEQLAFNL